MSDQIVDRVRAVIDRVSDSQAAFGHLIGISKDKLSKSLAGTRRFTSLELALVADAGGVTVDWLLTGHAPANSAVAARTSASVAPEAALIGQLLDRYVTAFDVLELLGRAGQKRAAPTVDEALSTTQQGFTLGEWAYERLMENGLPTLASTPLDELIRAVEDTFDVDVTVRQMPHGLDGLAWQSDRRRLILVATTNQWTRQRFTLAHELGHILANDAQQLVVDRHVAPGLDHEPSEMRANWFAGSLLMPETEIRRLVAGAIDDTAFAALVSSFMVSPGAMAARLRMLDLVSLPDFFRLRRLRTIECHRLNGTVEAYVRQLTVALGERLPERIVAELLEAYGEGRISLRPLANLLEVEVEDLAEMAADEDIDRSPRRSKTADLVYSL